MDGRQILGIVAPGAVGEKLVLTSEGEKIPIAEEDIDEINPSKNSSMPEGLLKELTKEEIADLFAYVSADPTASMAQQPDATAPAAGENRVPIVRSSCGKYRRGMNVVVARESSEAVPGRHHGCRVEGPNFRGAKADEAHRFHGRRRSDRRDFAVRQKCAAVIELVRLHQSVAETDDALGVERHVVFVCDDDDGLAGVAQLFEDRQDLDAGLGVQITGWFVGQDEVRVVDQAARDGNSLLLTTGQLRGPV